MKRLNIIIIALFCSIYMAAQGLVKGHVADKQTDERLQFVNVTVTNAATGKMVKGAITDAEGSFKIDGLADGKYNLTVSFVGYKSVGRQFSITKDKRQQSFALIYIAEDTKMLKEVEVTGQRSQLKLEVDRKSFSADQIIAAAGGSASDLLENIPSIEVSTDGEISLKGNSSVEVWINGKASGLTTDNRGEILQQIPAESIERVEVIDNPSAKFSAEGSAGIINIILKRDRKAGYYGSVRTGVNSRGGWNAGGNINYSSGTLDAFANIGYRRRKNKGGSESQQTYLDSQRYQNYESESNRGGKNLFMRGGLTWHATKKDDLSLSGMGMFGKREDSSLTPYHYGTLGNAKDDYIMTRLTNGGGDMRMMNIEGGYTHNFSDKHKIDLSVSHSKWKSDDNNYYRDSTDWMADDIPTTYNYQYRPMFINNKSWEVKLEYENQINDKWKIEAGYNGNFNHENTPQESWTDITWTGDNPTEDKAYFNRFIYDNKIHAFYGTVTTSIGKLGILAGLRGEYWKVNTESYDWDQEHDATKRDTPFKKDYFELFPSLFLNYQLTESSQLQLNYTRRLRRPWGGELNSFKNTRDASMISFGNPELTPEFTNSFALNFLKTWPEHTLSFGSYYRPTTDVIQRISYNDGGVMYSTNKNVAKSQRAGVELILKDKLFRLLDLTTTVNAYYYKLNGFDYEINGQTITGKPDENFSWDARMMASLILPYDISIQITGNYNSKRVITQGYRKPSFGLDFGLRKNFFNKALTLAVNWRGAFNTRKWETYTANDTFERYQKMWRSQNVNVNISWNFGNMNQKKKKGHEQEDNNGEEMNNGYGGGGEF